MAKSKIDILINAQDKATAVLKGLEKKAKSISSSFNQSALEINAKLELMRKALVALQKAFAFIEKGAKFTQQKEAFSNLAKSVGADSEKLIASLRDMSAQTISTSDTMVAASRAIALGLAPDKLPKLMEISRASARAFGQDVNFMFDSIVLGIGRQSKLILDNLGIIVKADEANDRYAKQMNITGRALNEAEKKQAFLNEAVLQGEDILRKVNIQGRTQFEMIQALKAQWEDFTTAFAEWISESEIVKSLFIGLGTAIEFYSKKLKELRGNTDALQDGLQLDLVRQILEVNKQIDALESSRANKGAGKIAIEEKVNDLLIVRERLQNTLNALKSEERVIDMEALANEAAKITMQEELSAKREEDALRFRQLAAEISDEERREFESRLEGATVLMQSFNDIQKQATQSVFVVYGQLLEQFNTGMSKAISGIILGTTKAKQAFTELGKAMVKTIVDWLIQRTIAIAISKALGKVMEKFIAVQATTIANMWAPAAALASLATLGSNSGPAIAGMTSTVVAAHGLAIGGLAEGGIVQARPGGRPFIIGEGGKDEAVIPLEEGGGSLGGITINIIEPRISGRDDIVDLAEELGFEVERSIRSARGF